MIPLSFKSNLAGRFFYRFLKLNDELSLFQITVFLVTHVPWIQDREIQTIERILSYTRLSGELSTD
jgi:hypothetical protein